MPNRKEKQSTADASFFLLLSVMIDRSSVCHAFVNTVSRRLFQVQTQPSPALAPASCFVAIPENVNLFLLLIYKLYVAWRLFRSAVDICVLMKALNSGMRDL
jgi:hypothetical protein